MPKANVLGYYVYEGNLCAEAVHVIVDTGDEDTYLNFSPTDGTTTVPKGWVDLAFRITKEQFLEASKGHIVPLEYL